MMGGELFEINQDTLRVVSLDGHRISIRNIFLKNSYPANKVIVPGKTLSEISKILSGDTDKDVMIYFTKNHILFEFDDTVVSWMEEVRVLVEFALDKIRFLCDHRKCPVNIL